jgi:hypothetical protein
MTESCNLSRNRQKHAKGQQQPYDQKPKHQPRCKEKRREQDDGKEESFIEGRYNTLEEQGCMHRIRVADASDLHRPLVQKQLIARIQGRIDQALRRPDIHLCRNCRLVFD